MDEEVAEVRWSRVAAVLAINRLCAPGSELAIEQRWYPSTALDDLLEIEEGKINDTRLYRCLDRMLPHKTKLEQHLKQRYGELFGAEFDVLLYDLTSTYVEGADEKNPMMRRGYSRDHRPDCEQMVIALIVNSEGFRSAMRPSMATEPTCRPWRPYCARWNGSTARHGGSGCISWLRRHLLRQPSAGTIRSLAVLPFENLSHDPEQEYFAEGMTDALTTEMAQIGALRVISELRRCSTRTPRSHCRKLLAN